jgi:hypothetical protein
MSTAAVRVASSDTSSGEVTSTADYTSTSATTRALESGDGTSTGTQSLVSVSAEGSVEDATVTEPRPVIGETPEVSIQTPVDHARFASRRVVIFAGAATDAEDGIISSRIVWTSSRDGRIGTGGAFSAGLSTGTHIITATVTDSDGNTQRAQVTILVGAGI